MDSDINYIIQNALKGDKNYQEILLKRLNPLIYKNIYRYYHPSNHLIEDLRQEGYIIVLQSLKDYDINRNVHFLQYVKINLHFFYKNYYKKSIKNNTLSFEHLNEIGKELKSNNMEHLTIMMINEEKDALCKCIDGLPGKEQAILNLFYFRQFSIQEISDELNLKYRTVINVKSNAVKKLRKRMKNLLFQ